jgi:hypothetical protein
LDKDEDVHDEEIIQRELVKIAMIKVKIIRIMATDDLVSDAAIGELRNDLSDFHQKLPAWMRIGSVFDSQRPTPLRRIIFYLHLFFLSAMQLLHRRVMCHPVCFEQSQHAKAAAREGLMAAKMASRVLSLMCLEGTFVQNCWMCT